MDRLHRLCLLNRLSRLHRLCLLNRLSRLHCLWVLHCLSRLHLLERLGGLLHGLHTGLVPLLLGKHLLTVAVSLA